MFISEKEFLFHFGWTDFFENQLSDLGTSSLVPARVICEERNLYRVQLGFNQIYWAQVTGKMQFNAVNRGDFPAVGDWVMVDIPPQSDRAVIHHVLQRKTSIYRKQVGSTSDLQILSTNVNYAFITSSVNADLNFRRIERYLSVVWDSGCMPVIILTKADICEDIEAVIAETQLEFPGVDVYAVSKDDFENAEFLPRYLKEGSTSVFIGSSGVGKSTLVNFLIGADLIKTQEAREDDDRGRHTTTSRQLYASRFGGLVIDTPGMRELQLSDQADGVSQQFAEVEELMTRCRFGDCQHQTEPGCAINEALEHGVLTEDRWRNYLKLQAEVRHALRKQDKAIAAQDRKVWKKKTAEGRERGLAKRR